MKEKRRNPVRPVLAAMFLALAIVLPLLTGQIKQVGNALCPMHIPVILCGYFCGPWYAALVGIIAPLLRFVIYSRPPLVPNGIAMCFELAAYGIVTGIMYALLPKKKKYIYVSLVTAMLAGRAVWGAAMTLVCLAQKAEFSFAMFMAGAFTNAVPGIIIQIALIPVIVITTEKAVKDRHGAYK